MEKGNSISASMVFKTLERYLVMAFQLIVQIVIARILTPEDYGVVAMMSVFINIANVFIQNGFNMALVQKKNAGSRDYSTALSINLFIGISLYLCLLCSSSYIANFYNQPLIAVYLPVLGLMLVIGAFNSIQIAISNRFMYFKSLFKCNVTASIVSGLIGIMSAYLGAGAWALIIQQLSNCFALSIMLLFQQQWKPSFTFDKKSATEMFSFGWKMLCAALLNQIYNELNSLVIGKRFASSDLAFYTKGKQFPLYITQGLDTSISTVMFSALSKKQSDERGLHEMMRKAMNTNTFLVFPCLAILAMGAEPFTVLILTEKWLPLVPYMQICCLTFAFHPIGTVQMQALAAVGRSDMRLNLEFVKKSIGLLLLFASLHLGPMAIAISAAATSILSTVIGAFACKYVVHYNYKNTVLDIVPTLSFAIISCVLMYFSSRISTNNSFISLAVIAMTGFLSYGLITIIFKPLGFKYIKQSYLKRKKNE